MNISLIRVILVDDHAVVRAGIRQFMETTEDIQVVMEAEDGLQAQELVGQYLPDVVILDIQMPQLSGVEVTRWIRTHYREMGILILSAYDDDPYILAVLEAGANGYVLKTASPGEIIQAVRDVYVGKSVLDPAVLPKVIQHIGSRWDRRTVEKLTDRENEVLLLVGKGYTNKAIAIQLKISDRTVQGHIAHIFNKLLASSRTEAVMRAVALGWLPADLGKLPSDG